MSTLYAYENGCEWAPIDVSKHASYNVHLNCPKYAHKIGDPLNKQTLIYVSRHGELECSLYAKEQLRKINYA